MAEERHCLGCRREENEGHPTCGCTNKTWVSQVMFICILFHNLTVVTELTRMNRYM